jgi:hypothetical protein
MSSIKEMRKQEIESIMHKYNLGTPDAIIIYYVNEMQTTFNKFLSNILQIEKAKDKTYRAITRPIDFNNELWKVAMQIVKLQTQLQKVHPEAYLNYGSHLDKFVEEVQAITPEGELAVVLKLKTGLQIFGMKLADRVKFKRIDEMQDSTAISNEDRALKVYRAGLKELAKHKLADAEILLKWMMKNAKGRMVTKREVSIVHGKNEAWAGTHLDEIWQHAPELIEIGLTSDEKRTYTVPEIFSKFDFSNK